MMFITHASFALFLGLLAIIFVDIPVNHYIFLSLLVIGSLFPDIDCADSFLGRKLKPLNVFFKHRGFFHSTTMLVILIIIMAFITRNQPSGLYYILSFVVGFISHLLIDSATTGGIAFFWPYKKRIKGKLRTGSLFDWIFLIATIITNVLLLL